MTFTELLTEVKLLTARPDLENESISAIRYATLKLHQSDFFYKDLVEKVLIFIEEEYIQQLDYKAKFPLWRSLKYLRKYDPKGNYSGAFLDVIDPTQVLDLYNTTKTDVCYVAGANLNIRSSTKQQFYIVGFYSNPDITTNTYNSWIANDHPYAIIYDAIATIFKIIGKQEDEANSRTLAAQERRNIVISNTVATGE